MTEPGRRPCGTEIIGKKKKPIDKTINKVIGREQELSMTDLP